MRPFPRTASPGMWHDGLPPRIAGVFLFIHLTFMFPIRVSALLDRASATPASAGEIAAGVVVIGALVGTSLLVALGRVPRGRAAWVLFALVVSGDTLIAGPVTVPANMVDAILTTLFVDLNVGVALFALTRLRDLVRQAHAVRDELAPLEVAGERLRIARNLRSVLGGSLSAIIYRSRRTLESAAASAEIVDIARDALADARRVADGFRERTLAAEVEAARSVLTTAGVETRIAVHSDLPLPAEADVALGRALRGTTITLLRNGGPRTCQIEVGGAVRLRVTCQGRPAAPASPT
ncbi:hypothetical protein ACQPYK_07350 [Streptosporangium sp. CA-135522]|uniref:hypothetical protein n=1 Tax=Streptosporangium sp. CA-135522 TaxID=3240072 RepID=UPI003D8ED4B6